MKYKHVGEVDERDTLLSLLMPSIRAHVTFLLEIIPCTKITPTCYEFLFCRHLKTPCFPFYPFLFAWYWTIVKKWSTKIDTPSFIFIRLQVNLKYTLLKKPRHLIKYYSGLLLHKKWAAIPASTGARQAHRPPYPKSVDIIKHSTRRSCKRYAHWGRRQLLATPIFPRYRWNMSLRYAMVPTVLVHYHIVLGENAGFSRQPRDRKTKMESSPRL